MLSPSHFSQNKKPSKALVVAAFIGLYIIWGSTYIAIKYALPAFPPFFLVAFRFLIAGSLLFGWCLFKGEKLPNLKSLLVTGFSGVLLLVVGNGAVSWAEQYLPSGLTAIVVATVPIWFVILDKRQWRYHFSNRIIIVGILTGFAGVVLLFSVKGSVSFSGNNMNLISLFVVIAGTIGWAIGSLISKYKEVQASSTMKAAVQMLTAGVVALCIALPDSHSHFNFSAVTLQPALALCYLVIFGSLIGFMSYIWLLSVRPASLVGTYAYVNPVVALFLGWLMAGETITLPQVFALFVILLGVILVSYKNKPVENEAAIIETET